MDDMNSLNENPMLDKVGMIMMKLHENQKLQDLASQNGIEVKNTIHLTEDTANNIAVGVVALMLAKQENDPDYAALVRAGMNHRKIKTELINKYKNQANQLIDSYKMKMRDAIDA